MHAIPALALTLALPALSLVGVTSPEPTPPSGVHGLAVPVGWYMSDPVVPGSVTCVHVP